MTSYLRLFLAIPLAGAAFMLALNVAVDPFDIYRLIVARGFNEVKPARDADGGRVAVSHALLRGGYRAVVVGNSRIRFGFPQAVPEILGGFLNAGVPALNAQVMARMLSHARRTAGVDCAFVSLDFESFDDIDRGKGSYSDSALPDGARLRSWLAVALSYQTSQASLETFAVNALGYPLKVDHKFIPNSAAHRASFIQAAHRIFEFHRTFHYDAQRLDLVTKVIDLMTSGGIQVIGFFPPQHAWNEEVAFDGDRYEEYFRFRRDVLRKMGAFASRPARAPCGGAGAFQLWDFGGYRALSTAPAPGDTNAGAISALYREAMHFEPPVGRGILLRMIGKPASLGISDLELGEAITNVAPDRLESKLLARRAAWLASSADAVTFKMLVAHWRRTDPVPPEPLRSFVQQADFDGL